MSTLNSLAQMVWDCLAIIGVVTALFLTLGFFWGYFV